MWSTSAFDGGFHVFDDSQLLFTVNPDTSGAYGIFYYADFVGDGWIAGHGEQVEDMGGWWKPWADPVGFTMNDDGMLRNNFTGMPVWANSGGVACFESYQNYTVNAATGGGYTEVDSCLQTSAIPEPSVILCLLGSALLLLLRQRGSR